MTTINTAGVYNFLLYASVCSKVIARNIFKADNLHINRGFLINHVETCHELPIEHKDLMHRVQRSEAELFI